MEANMTLENWLRTSDYDEDDIVDIYSRFQDAVQTSDDARDMEHIMDIYRDARPHPDLARSEFGGRPGGSPGDPTRTESHPMRFWIFRKGVGQKFPAACVGQVRLSTAS
jgi:hypothetical protein